MIQRRSSDDSRLLGGLLVTIIILALGTVGLIVLPGFADRIADSQAPKSNLLLLGISPVAGVLWLMLLMSGRHIEALGLLIMALPVFSRSVKLLNVGTATTSNGITHTVGIITVALFLFAIVLLFSKNSWQKSLPLGLWGPLVIYALAGTVSQILNHDVRSALLLSLTAFWQWVVLIYIVFRVVDRLTRVVTVMQFVVLTLILGTFLRIITTGNLFFARDETGELLRVGGAGFGAPIYYSGYLILGVIFAVYMTRRTTTIWGVVFWGGATCLLFLEMLNTSTRGAVIALAVGLLVTMVLDHGKKSMVMIIVIIVALPVTSQVFEMAFSGSRHFPKGPQLIELPHVQDRIELVKVTTPKLFDRSGFGYGISNTQYFEVNGKILTAHHLYGNVALGSGGVAMLALIAFTLGTSLYLIKLIWAPTEDIRRIALYIAGGLIAWLIHANTSSSYITWLVPYEAIMLVFLSVFLLMGLRDEVPGTSTDSDKP